MRWLPAAKFDQDKRLDRPRPLTLTLTLPLPAQSLCELA
jgi:hypothetical protein